MCMRPSRIEVGCRSLPRRSFDSRCALVAVSLANALMSSTPESLICGGATNYVRNWPSSPAPRSALSVYLQGIKKTSRRCTEEPAFDCACGSCRRAVSRRWNSSRAPHARAKSKAYRVPKDDDVLAEQPRLCSNNVSSLRAAPARTRRCDRASAAGIVSTSMTQQTVLVTRPPKLLRQSPQSARGAWCRLRLRGP